MPKEYRTIEEVAGPLMLVRGVQNVTYDELGEIELADGEKRRCKVLEIDGGKCPWCSCLRASAGNQPGVQQGALLRPLHGAGRLRGHAEPYLLTGWAAPSTAGRRSCRRSA